MKTGRLLPLLCFAFLIFFIPFLHAEIIKKFDNKIKQEGTYSKNSQLLSNCNGDKDKLTWQKFTWDPCFSYISTNEECDWDAYSFKAAIRCKGTYGAPEAAYRTAPSMIKDDEVVLGWHQHPLTIHIPIVREIWLDLSVSDLFGAGFNHRHSFTMGLFPFQLGRGIALGDAYATMPDLIGYDPASNVDQYAPGFRLSGSMADDKKCDYDLYVGILSNRSYNFAVVNENILGSIYGHRQDQARGFGVFNYILAGRLKSQLIDQENRKLYLEPYALLNDEREQRVEFIGDATQQMGTLGFAAELQLGEFEFGFDTALNVGGQHVRGLDRNIIKKEYRAINALQSGSPDNVVVGWTQTFINSAVTATADNPKTGDIAGKKAVFCPDNQTIINSQIADAGVCSSLAAFNGQVIPNPTNGAPTLLKNSNTRFRDPYKNSYGGAMMVADFAYHICYPDVKVAGTVGYATGDVSPNQDLDEPNDSAVDGNYNGFIGLQEIYSGKRVRSSFLLAGKSGVPRLLAFPTPNVGGGFPVSVSRFTNLIFTGGALWYEHETGTHTWKFNPNIITFWQEFPTRVVTRSGDQFFARNHLGTEVNLFMDVLIAKGLTFSMLGGFFIPGSYFEDVKGRPINKAQIEYLDRFDKTGVAVGCPPQLGDDPAFFINAGFEYKF